jgi:hypothetical protein
MTIRAMQKWSVNINRTEFMRLCAPNSILLPCAARCERPRSSTEGTLVNRQVFAAEV